MPRRTDRVFFGADRPYSLNQARHGNIYETKRDDLNVIAIASRAVLLCSGFFSERVDFQPNFFILFSQHWQNSSVCT